MMAHAHAMGGPLSRSTRRSTLAWIHMVGGLAVLASYAIGLEASPGANALWGGVPVGLRPVYAVSMFAAAAGYFAFTFFMLYRLDPRTIRVGRFGYGIFHALTLAILLPSALWMPLTVEMIAHPSTLLWLAIRAVLGCVGLASLALVVALLRARPRHPGLAHRLAVAGAVAFSFQTALLDAVLWPAWFPA